MSEDRERLETMLEALDASPGALRRPACRGWAGDYQITGRLGHILADGDGFLLHIHTGHRQANAAPLEQCQGAARLLPVDARRR
jgi:hypothetical protein